MQATRGAGGTGRASGRRAATFALMATSLALATAGAEGLAAQADSVTMVPGPGYAEPPLATDLVGSSYRDLWSTPIRVEVLDPKHEAGGLSLLRRAGGRHTASLRFIGAGGREFAFRSVDKFPRRVNEEEFAGTLLGRIVADQVSSLVPGAPVIAARLSAAAGLLHPGPRLVVMPDDPVLGVFRDDFAGMLGTFEEHPDEVGDGRPGFAGYDRVTGTEELLANLAENPRHRIDDREYLAARLLDLVLGDWDRHADQWRWAREIAAGGFVWRPIARDRDYAMSDYDGRLIRAAALLVPNLVRFTAGVPDIGPLIWNSRSLDARLLSALDRPAWDSIAVDLQRRLTDAEISAAVRSLPDPFVARRGDELARTLEARRDAIGTAAREFYLRLAEVPEIHGTDVAEDAIVDRQRDGSVSVTLRSNLDGRERTIFSRTFDPEETREIRIFLGGGDDAAVVRGRAERGIVVRLIGGDGTDRLADSSFVAKLGPWTFLHDDDPGDRLLGGRATVVDRRPAPEAAPADPQAGPFTRGRPDYGLSISPAPILDYSSARGVLVGASVGFTRRGFRRDPYRSRVEVAARVAPRWGTAAVTTTADVRTADPGVRNRFELALSGLDYFRFHGFGDETDAPLGSSAYVVRSDRVEAGAFHFRMLGGFEVGFGGTARFADYSAPPGSPFREFHPSGEVELGVAGIRATIVGPPLDDTPESPVLDITSVTYPVTSDGRRTFGTLRGLTHASLPLPRPRGARTIFRLGGSYSWGPYPIEDAAFLGGDESLRGYRDERFAGDAAAHASVDAIVPLGRIPVVVNWLVEGSVFADVGRVFLEGERSKRWHVTPGIGVRLSVFDSVLRAEVAWGDGPRINLDADIDL